MPAGRPGGARKKIREHNPALKAILLTGSREAAIQDAAKKLVDCAILFKPVNIEEIEAHLRKVVQA